MRSLSQREHETLRDVSRAVASDDLELLHGAFERLHRYLLWPSTMRKLRRQGLQASPRMQREFLAHAAGPGRFRAFDGGLLVSATAA